MEGLLLKDLDLLEVRRARQAAGDGGAGRGVEDDDAVLAHAQTA